MKYLSEEQNKCFVGTGELNKALDRYTRRELRKMNILMRLTGYVIDIS